MYLHKLHARRRTGARPVGTHIPAKVGPTDPDSTPYPKETMRTLSGANRVRRMTFIAIDLCSPSRTDNEQTTNEQYEDDYDTEPWPGSDSDSEPDADADSNSGSDSGSDSDSDTNRSDHESECPLWDNGEDWDEEVAQAAAARAQSKDNK